MKLALNLLAGLILMFFTDTCNNSSAEGEQSSSAKMTETSMQITGTIQEQGITSYQYGTHTISTADDKFYALKSEKIDLNEYIDEEVTILAEKIEGYPLSGGPEYLLVLEVK